MIVDGTDVVEILKQLSTATEKERTRIIESVRPILSSPEGRRKYKNSIETSDLNIVFDCLNASGTAEILAASEILDQILEFVDASRVLNKYSACLNRCLNHPHPAVKAMVMKFLRRCLGTDQSLQQLIGEDNLLVDVTKLIADDGGTVAKEVKLFFYTMATLNSTERVNSMPFVQPILPVLQELLNHEKEVYRLRVEELMISIAKLSPEMTERVARAGFLQRVCQEILTDDVLVQLNALEILSDFAETKHGLLYLTDQGVLRDMDKLLNESSSSPMASYLLPGFIKFFGRVSRNQPSNFTENYPNFTNTILSLIENDNNTNTEPGMKNLAIATIGHISTSLKGKQKLASIDGFLHGSPGKITKAIVNCLKYGRTDEKVVALNTFADILSTPENEQDVYTSSELSKAFYICLPKVGMQNPMDYMFQIIKQPFAEVSEAAYTILQNIGNKTWGVKLFTEEPGLLEYILDRNVAIKKEAKEMKYNLIKTLQDNPTGMDDNVMPPEMLNKLKRYIREGPFYVEAQAEVALGEG